MAMAKPLADPSAEPIPPGSTIGIIGGGQLGRMTALAAARLGYRCCILCDDPQSPAAQVAAEVITPSHSLGAVDEFAARAAVVTIEWENIPISCLEILATKVPCHPHPSVVTVCQDRIAEKTFLANGDFPVTLWRKISDLPTLQNAVFELGKLELPLFLKQSRDGYDGKGQVIITEPDRALTAWQQIGKNTAILEAAVPYRCEISVIVARSSTGSVMTYPPVENIHQDGILIRTLMPARIDHAIASAARELSVAVSEQLQVVGLLTVELFVRPDGQLVINELAPRPHNSGHWTIDACSTSQFEQLVRAICGLPLGSVEPTADHVTMENLLGQDWKRWPQLLGQSGLRLHLYGKSGAAGRRKMGHITRFSR